MGKQRWGNKAIETFIEFREVGTSKSGITKIWEVVNTMGNDDSIGIVRWHGPWRKYVYECSASFYDWDCLRYIADFVERQTMEHRNAKKT